MNADEELTFRNQATNDGVTHISTGVAIVRDDKILIVRRAAADYLGGQYELPGGGVDEDETLEQAAIREVAEETGLNVSKVISTFAGFDYATDRKSHVRQINFLVEVEDGEVKLNVDEHDEYRWVDASDDLNDLMSDSMQVCVAEAVRLISQKYLYLITLEIDDLKSDVAYNPLPSHLTLMSRYRSELPPDEMASAIRSLFDESKPFELCIGSEAVIGPKNTAVYLLQTNDKVIDLHLGLLDKLSECDVSFTLPQFIGEHYKPHISKRENDSFQIGYSRIAKHAYLIEVEKVGSEDLRYVRAKFSLGV